MFTNCTGVPSKKDMVDSWKALFSLDVGGHSARRAAPMGYVRRGMSIRDVAMEIFGGAPKLKKLHARW